MSAENDVPHEERVGEQKHFAVGRTEKPGEATACERYRLQYVLFWATRHHLPFSAAVFTYQKSN